MAVDAARRSQLFGRLAGAVREEAARTAGSSSTP